MTLLQLINPFVIAKETTKMVPYQKATDEQWEAATHIYADTGVQAKLATKGVHRKFTFYETKEWAKFYIPGEEVYIAVKSNPGVELKQRVWTVTFWTMLGVVIGTVLTFLLK